ncbi:MAG TPA: glycoside hydrolase family 38 C-terminal domain-containing protein [candidate division Zixibacteria bacterium]|nr:glycoside hydrolase family 38 C-terminal domain-containing protein [candidate division Zixibacteria bacterium]
MLKENDTAEVIIIPHTHWDREWYEPFQVFRFQLVKLIDNLLKIMKDKDYKFMLDGQTIVLEDYFEIRPEKKEEVLKLIREGKIAAGPWYILPDEWLVGQESLIRNLEISFDLAKEFNIPMMKVGYLPDQFGHSRVIPQMLADLTDFEAAVIWRGVGEEISTVPFIWKSHEKSDVQILSNYMPQGYGNFAGLTEEKNAISERIKQTIDDLIPYSPLPVYLLMNGTDHQLPQEFLIDYLSQKTSTNLKIKIGLLDEYIELLKKNIKEQHYNPPIYYGEFRSSKRAPLLQDTYSARMWIKQWDNKIEDLLVHFAEPIGLIIQHNFKIEYPGSYIKLAWKWLLKNQPHDSICGCSVDQTHEEMKARYFWAESIAKSVITDELEKIQKTAKRNANSYCYVFNPTNNEKIPMYFEFESPLSKPINSLIDGQGNSFEVQQLSEKEDVMFEDTMIQFLVKSGLNMLPGRKLIDVYINEVIISESPDPTICNITIICDKEPIGDFDVKSLKQKVSELIDSKKYQKFHVKATKGSKQKYCAIVPLTPLTFNKFLISESAVSTKNEGLFITKNSVKNQFYDIYFNKDGTMNIYDKKTKTTYENLHMFEDWGDRGDEYTFSRLGPVKRKISQIKRKITTKGSFVCEITQTFLFETFKELNEKRDKRIGKVKIPIKSKFRFYRDIPRIDIETTLTNKAKDHRLRICFNLPYSSNYTLTSTHFGFTKRQAQPDNFIDFIEQPSGIQAQKRFIRVENETNTEAFTLFNKGLPEVELTEGNILALTLLRCTGFLSRSDFPERPLHAGPFLASPGAQEMNQNYNFKYSFSIHSKGEDILFSVDHSDAFNLESKAIVCLESELNDSITKPIITVNNPMIRISSLRMKNKNLYCLLYNYQDIETSTKINFTSNFTVCQEKLIDGTIKNKTAIINRNLEMSFKPFEIKLLEIQ